MIALERDTIFLALAGSHAHGTARPGSDVDVRGVCIAPLKQRLSLFASFEQFEGALPEPLAGRVLPLIATHPIAASNLANGCECVVFDLAKLIRLCVAANPNALEILFADERDWLLESESWRRLYAARHAFVTKQVQHTFLGYAMAQLAKIETHRSWLLSPPRAKPSREDFGLPADSSGLGRDDQHRIERSIADKLRAYGIDDLDMPKPLRIALSERLRALQRDVVRLGGDLDAALRQVATRALSLPEDVISVLDAEKRYRAAQKHWESYQTWKRQRNPARAELERRHGYDTKHAMHLVRLMRMGIEALESGELRVRRADAKELSSIRDGALSFDALTRLTSELRERMQRAAASTSLPDEVDTEHIDRLAFELMTASRFDEGVGDTDRECM